MQMTLTVYTPRRRPRPVDVVVCWSGAHEATDLCTALAAHLRMPVPFVTSHGVPVPASHPVGVPPLVHGASIAVGGGSPEQLVRGAAPSSAIELVAVGGPDAGRAQLLVPPGVHVGRSVVRGLSLADGALSRVHALVRVGPAGLVIEDVGSTNGVRVDGRPVEEPTPVDSSSTIVLGSTTVRVRRGAGTGIPVEIPGDGTVIVRPTSDAAGEPGLLEVACPVPPTEPARTRIPWVGALVPVPIGVALAWFLGPQLLLFTLLGPIALLANAAADRWGAGRTRRRDRAVHAMATRAAHDALALALRTEAARLERAHPDPHEVLRTAEHRLPGLWRTSGMEVRLGMGQVATRVVWVEGTSRTHPRVEHGPVVLDLEQVGLLGVVGATEVTSRILGNVVGQLCTRIAPGRLSVSVASDDPAWEWVHRIPHAVSGRPGDGSSPAMPDVRHLLVVPEGDATSRAAPIAEERSTGGVVVVAVPQRAALPLGCGAVLSDAGNGRHELHVDDRCLTFSIDLVGAWWSDRVSRALAPLRWAGDGDAAELPSEVRLPVLLGLEHVTAADVLSRWADTSSGPSSPVRPPAAMVGLGAEGPHEIDLRRDGPHVLVGGTTGSGKSELLRTLVTSLALSRPPAELTFLLVDFKGGAAFGASAELPHVVGLVTDLDDHLVARALTSLGAEIRRRERLFAAAGATDIDTYARCTTGRSEPVPRLVVVIDELRALVDDVPDFVRGLIRLAALGRSLGIHLVLATQRPSGVVTAEIQANVNLRIALRMRDRSDSFDVLEDPAAASIPSAVPGRALLRGGDGSLVAMQTATVEAAARRDERRFLTASHARREPGSPREEGSTGRLGSGSRPDRPIPSNADPDLVAAIIRAHELSGAPAPRTPWLPPLPDYVSALAEGAESAMVGVVDEPDLQRTSPLVWRASDGSWLLSGRPRTGRTTALRAVVLEASATLPPDRLHIHVIDVSGSLSDLALLPHVGTTVDVGDGRTVAELVSHLQEEVRRRRAGSTRRSSCDPAEVEEPTLLLVVDGWDQLVEGQTDARRLVGMPGDDLLRVLRDGHGVGVVAAVSGGRSLIQSRWTGLGCETFLLGGADPLDAALAGLRTADLATTPPPGRGIRLRDRRTVQFAAATPECTAAVAERSDRPSAELAALVLRALPSVVRRSPPGRSESRVGKGDGRPAGARTPEHDPRCEALAVGVSGRSPTPWSWDPCAAGRRLLVAGPDRSGRSNTLRVLAESAAAGGRVVVVVRARDDGRHRLTFPCAVLMPTDADDLMTLRRHQSDLVVLVDDAHLLDGTPVLQPLREIAELVDRDGGLVAVTTPTHALATRFRGLDVDVARHGTGLLLAPRPTDGEAFGLRQLGAIPPTPGRAVFVHDGRATEVQVFLADDGSGAAVRTGDDGVLGPHRERRQTGRRRDREDHPADEGALALDEADADGDQQEIPDDGRRAGPRRLPQPPPGERAEADRSHEYEQGGHQHARGVAALAGGELVHIERGEAGEHQCLQAGEECGEAAGAA